MVQRAECRPAVSENYMRLKRWVYDADTHIQSKGLVRRTECVCVCVFFRMQIEESSKPVRLSQQLDKAVTNNYKPVANHSYNVSALIHTSTFLLPLHLLSSEVSQLCVCMFFLSWSMTGRRRRRASEHVLISSRCWTYCFPLLRSTSTTTSKTWWTSRNSLW